MGAADPLTAAEHAANIGRELQLSHLKVVAVLGDDVAHLITPQTKLVEPDCVVADIDRPLIGANAYLGAESILPALTDDADLIITGRVADPSLFVAPMQARFGWSNDDWEHLAIGTMAGHLMECAAQVTGGYFADPGFKVVENLAMVGFPIAEVTPDGDVVITKLSCSGGRVDQRHHVAPLLEEIVLGGRARLLRQRLTVLPNRAPLVFGTEDFVAGAMRAMQDQHRGCVLVSSDGTPGGQLAGIFTERDVLNKIIGQGRNPALVKLSEVMIADPEALPSLVSQIFDLSDDEDEQFHMANTRLSKTVA